MDARLLAGIELKEWRYNLHVGLPAGGQIV